MRIQLFRESLEHLRDQGEDPFVIAAIEDVLYVLFPLEHDNQLQGGHADGYTVRDIANHHNVSEEQIIDQLGLGINVEMEHTDDPYKSIEIAMDHLYEIPDYYDRLDEMETKAGITESQKSKKKKASETKDDLKTDSTFLLSQLAGNLFMMD